MSDPIDDLRNLSHQGVDVTPLPPAEVRRRGDRLRRRQRALAVVGGVAAVALIATPIAVLSTGSKHAAPPVTTPTTSTTATPTPSVPEPVSHEIADDYPLVAGWPDDSQAESASFGLKGPSRSMALMELTACDQTLAYPAYVDRLSASWSNPEDYRHRQLMTFGDADQAVAFVDQFAQLFRGCPVDPAGSDGYTPHHLVLDTQTGGQSVAVANYYEYDGAPAVGLELIHAIRLGRAVLLISESGEGGAGPVDQREAIFRQSIGRMTDAASAPIAAMCVFTEAGCGDASGDVLGPDGYGALHLGMTAAEIEATGLATVHPFDDPAAACQTLTIKGWRDTEHPNISGQVHGFVSRKHGLAIIFAQPGMRTPEGIGVGSTVEEVRAAYGELSGSDAYTTPPVNGIRYFIFTDLAGKVTAFQIELADQDCVH